MLNRPDPFHRTLIGTWKGLAVPDQSNVQLYSQYHSLDS